MNTRSTDCWSADPSARAIKIVQADGTSLLLKHDHLIYAKLESGEHGQTFVLNFATHEVRINGHALRRLESALQRMELASINAQPDHMARNLVDGHPVVKSIEVSEV